MMASSIPPIVAYNEISRRSGVFLRFPSFFSQSMRYSVSPNAIPGVRKNTKKLLTLTMNHATVPRSPA